MWISILKINLKLQFNLDNIYFHKALGFKYLTNYQYFKHNKFNL